MPSRTPAAWPCPKACAAAMRCSTSSHGAATARRRRPWRRRPSRSCASSQRPIAPVTTVCASSPRRSIVERHDLLALMTKLKLAGMRAAYDDIMRDGLKRQRSVQQILGDLLSAEVAGEASPLDQLSNRRRQAAAGQGADRVRVHREPGQRGPRVRPARRRIPRDTAQCRIRRGNRHRQKPSIDRHHRQLHTQAKRSGALLRRRRPGQPSGGRGSRQASPAGWPSNSPALIWWRSTNSAICLSPSRAASCCCAPDKPALRADVDHRHHQSRLRRMVLGVRRRQDDHRLARSPHASLRHRRDRQRKLGASRTAPELPRANRVS